jgi:hypothetical protein
MTALLSKLIKHTGQQGNVWALSKFILFLFSNQGFLVSFELKLKLDLLVFPLRETMFYAKLKPLTELSCKIHCMCMLTLNSEFWNYNVVVLKVSQHTKSYYC